MNDSMAGVSRRIQALLLPDRFRPRLERLGFRCPPSIAQKLCISFENIRQQGVLALIDLLVHGDRLFVVLLRVSHPPEGVVVKCEERKRGGYVDVFWPMHLLEYLQRPGQRGSASADQIEAVEIVSFVIQCSCCIEVCLYRSRRLFRNRQ